MAKERIISADSHVAIRENAVLAHLAKRHHEAYQRARMEYLTRLMKRAKPKQGGGDLPIS